MRVLATLTAFLPLAFSSANADKLPGVLVDHQAASTREYIGSPSIVIAPNGDYVATHDLFGAGSSSTTSAESKVFVSQDRGTTWRQTATFPEQFWSNLFVVKSRIYLMGTNFEYGRIVIRTSDDNGKSWSAVHYLTTDFGYHTAPVPTVLSQGRIYRAFEHHPTGKWGSFEAFVMWAPENSDLTNPSSWSFSDRLSFPIGDEGNTWLEGNAVIAPDKSVVDILRVDDRARAAILKLSGGHLALDRFVDFPGGAKKFTVRYDPTSKLYWTLSNPALPGESLAASSPAKVRNTLALMSSPDLTHWTPRLIVLHHDDPAFYAFQYVDWQFDGKDIILVSRTAFDDESGHAHRYHDANFLTFHRIPAFRNLGSIMLESIPATSTKGIQSQQIQK